MSEDPAEVPRRMLVVGHTGREDAIEAAFRVIGHLHGAGVIPVFEPSMAADLSRIAAERVPGSAEVLGEGCEAAQLEIAVVLGGDGTILAAAELVRGTGVPVIGVNLGHVGFLAESERDSLPLTMRRVLARDYEVEERLALRVLVEADGQIVHENWALNEASVEKANRAKMLEVVVEVDAQPLSSFGCDGVILSTPTGSTAYSFSAGGPVVWPSVEALLLVPNSAHALFAGPIVVGPDSVLAVELIPRTREQGVLWCDGRRSFDLPAGARIEATRSDEPVRLARLHRAPFSRRLVDKFQLPTSGWRGPVVA